jgi:hypothetical protein
VRPSRRETIFLCAIVAALAAAIGWFFAFDPTQWGRHLMPAVYVAVAVGVYCLADVRRASALLRHPYVERVLYAALVVAIFFPARAALDYSEFWGWQASYARTCRAGDVLSPPCSQNDGLRLITQWAGDICHTANPFDPGDHCMSDDRAKFLARAVEELENPATPERQVYSAMYSIVVIQYYTYQRRPLGVLNEEDFLADFAPLVCGKSGGVLYDRLAAGGMNVDAVRKACDAQRLEKRAA